MARGRKYTEKEYDLIDRYKRENQKLKEQISKLRKQISRLDLGRYSTIKELIEKHEAAQTEVEQQPHKEQLKKLWECFECRSDVLRMITFERRDGIFYFRKCNSCGHRTHTQKLNKDTKMGPKNE